MDNKPTYDAVKSEMAFEFNGERHSFTVTQKDKAKPIGELLKEEVLKVERAQKAKMEVSLMAGTVKSTVKQVLCRTIFCK